eukprot:scaffold13449_cov28-Tisochrysis_lutea.AAC.1
MHAEAERCHPRRSSASKNTTHAPRRLRLPALSLCRGRRHAVAGEPNDTMPSEEGNMPMTLLSLAKWSTRPPKLPRIPSSTSANVAKIARSAFASRARRLAGAPPHLGSARGQPSRPLSASLAASVAQASKPAPSPHPSVTSFLSLPAGSCVTKIIPAHMRRAAPVGTISAGAMAAAAKGCMLGERVRMSIAAMAAMGSKACASLSHGDPAPSWLLPP